MKTENFDDAISVLPYKIRSILVILDENIKSDTYELRLRKNRPIMLYGKFGSVFIKPDSTYSAISYHGAVYVTDSDIRDTISAVCDYSVYSKQNDMINGYLTYGKGHRVGLSGEAVSRNGHINMIKNIDSVCIRITKDKICIPADVAHILDDDFRGIIIAGRPCSGKTTLLRGIAEYLSDKNQVSYNKIIVIDERYELILQSDINCDVLRGYSKKDGIIHSIRSLSPDIIICDEISDLNEAERIEEGFNSGVKFIVSVHASSVDELYSRSVSAKLINTGCFDTFILLKNGNQAGRIDGIYSRKDVKI